MGTTAHSDAARDPFEQTHRVVGEMIAWFGADAHALDHAAFETQLQERITELGRQRATHDGPRFTAEAQRAQRREQFQRRQRATSGSARIGPTRHVQRTTQWRVASGE